MTTTTLPTIPPLDFDPIELMVDTYAVLARRSATGTWAGRRWRVLRRERQARFAKAWGLR